MANVLVSVTMAATVRTAGDMVYQSGQSYSVPPSTAYRWVTQGLATTGTAPTIAATVVNIKARTATAQLASTTYLSQPSDWWIEYGKTTSYGQRSSVGPNTVAATTGDSIPLGSLTPSTLYHYRVVAVGAGGRVNQADQTFTTLAPAINP